MGFLDKMIKKVIVSKPADKPAPKAENKPESKPASKDAEYGGLRQQEPAAGPGANTGYSAAAPQGRPERVRVQKPKPAENHGGSWTPGEEIHLKKSYDSGVSIEAIAADHGRTREAIAHRLIKLGYTGITTKKRHKFA